MNRKQAEFAGSYASALLSHLAGGGEAGLKRAYDLGRRGVELNLGVLELEAMHRAALEPALRAAETAEDSRRALALAEDFLAESLAPFEMTHRGFREANASLQRLNRSLEGEIVERKRAEVALRKAQDELEARVSLRTQELADANASLKSEIVERQRYESELLLRDRAIEASSVGIVITETAQPDYPIIYANPAFAQLTGYPRDELIGRNPRFLQGAETDPEAVETVRKTLREGGSCLVTLLNYRKNGTPFWNELFISPVRDAQGRITHYIGIQTDVTQLRQAEEERHELEIAKHIQLSLLPGAPLRAEGIQVAGYCLPAFHVGGDYFDYFRSEDSVDIVIADVSGHSVGAALIMAETRSTLKAEALRRLHAQRGWRRRADRPLGTGEILRDLNILLFDDLERAGLFITLFYMKVYPASRRLCYSSAGHNRPLLLRPQEAECWELDAEGLILGVTREVVFEEKSLALQSGDLVLLYTDGVTEAQEPRGEFFGTERLARVFARLRAKPPEAIIAGIVAELRSFCRGGAFADDVSLVVLKVE
jgi:PAS domain S-box-containing protein